MQIIKSITDLSCFLCKHKEAGKSIGFVPTMGALHRGHISLIECSVQNKDVTIASIFVNPTQFNNPSDYQNYPISIETDLEMLEKAGCEAVFLPTKQEMYPEPDTRKFDFAGLDLFMEGKHRPGHFNGVAQIVTKLFEIVRPNRAYFGRKDFQQLAIIKHITAKYQAHLKVEIIGCEIIREPDGLAMSSRNRLLSKEYREAAGHISATLFKYQKLKNELNAGEIQKRVSAELSANTLLEPEYFEIVNNQTLAPVDPDSFPGEETTGCVAVFAGKVRLIDNIPF